ncbi:ATP-dependent Clp protease proteolytic subunit [Thioclava litoralis]|uniref:ATP-dependent Clp protease proteolytic subunit n=1 Tax=Thioclava litoralis TaxID=3076557 RepID=A0ABZ1DX11_9RHOB|nr:ATP-dependent Clp protease proteolytic subunit [Thioclava sp. FTW29]
MPQPLLQGAEIVLTGAILPDPYVYPEDEGVFSPAMVRRALDACAGQNAITLRVNSPGGDPSAAEDVRMMLSEAAAHITVRIIGEACSAASLLVMGADRIEMSAGSVMMIHDPSVLAMGNAADHLKAAERLESAAQGYAAIYAARAKIPAQEARALMVAETWMTAEEAVDRGFADAVIAGEARASPDGAGPVPEVAPEMMAESIAAAQRHYSETCLRMSALTARRPNQSQPAQMATKEVSMPTPTTQTTQTTRAPEDDAGTPAAVPTPGTPTPEAGTAPVPQPSATMQMNSDQAVANERRRARAILSAARPHMSAGSLSESFVEALIDEGVSIETASHRMLQEISAAQPDISMARSERGARHPARVGREDRDTRREGLAMALTARISGAAPEDDRARPYMEMSIHEMAAAATGARAPGFGSYASREDVIMSAMQSGSDFPNILSLSVNRVLEQGYDLIGRTFTEISREMEFNDFREHTVVRPDEFPGLRKVNQTGEIKFGSIGDSSEMLALGSYATGLSISRQALVNDDMGAIQSVIDNAGAIVPEFEESLFWQIFLSNPKLRDGVEVFHADHGNLAAAGTGISVTSLSAGRKALRQMKAADGERVIAMNAPAILLVGPENETLAEQYLAQNVQPTKAADVNTFSGKLRPVVVEAIEGKEWYLFVDPSKRSHVFKHGYLRGRKAPRVRVDEPFGVQGMRMTLEHDFGAGAVNFRGAYKNPGQ